MSGDFVSDKIIIEKDFFFLKYFSVCISAHYKPNLQGNVSKNLLGKKKTLLELQSDEMLNVLFTLKS